MRLQSENNFIRNKIAYIVQSVRTFLNEARILVLQEIYKEYEMTEEEIYGEYRRAMVEWFGLPKSIRWQYYRPRVKTYVALERIGLLSTGRQIGEAKKRMDEIDLEIAPWLQG